jgi:hypothetical protein
MLDAGSLVSVHDKSGRFPHVPAYLPPELFHATQRGEVIVPDDAVQAVMAGRTLYEAATGTVPHPGRPVDLSRLAGSDVSSPVGDVIARLCTGEYADARSALDHLYQSASRRVAHGNDPRRKAAAKRKATRRPRHQEPRVEAQSVPRTDVGSPAPEASVSPASGTPAYGPHAPNDQILPPPRKPTGLFGRLLGKLLRR